MINTIIFDLGGVIITLDPQQAVSRFQAIGIADAASRLDSYTQQGIFGDLEGGRIDAETFRTELSKLAGHDVSHEACAYAWQGYAKELPQRNIDLLADLRRQGYRLLLSNTNPYMMEWADSPRFDGHGHGVSHYFDALYLSYRMKLMKPDETIFRQLLIQEQLPPSQCLFVDDGPRNVAAASQVGMRTFCPQNGHDWTREIFDYLH